MMKGTTPERGVEKRERRRQEAGRVLSRMTVRDSDGIDCRPLPSSPPSSSFTVTKLRPRCPPAYAFELVRRTINMWFALKILRFCWLAPPHSGLCAASIF